MRDLVFLAFLAIALAATVRFPFASILLWAWFTLATPQAASYWAGQLSLNTVIAGVTFLTFFFHGEFTRMRLGLVAWLLIAFGGWLWMSQEHSLLPEYSAVFFDRYIKIILFILLCTLSVRSRLRFHALLWILVAVMGFYGAKGGLYTILTLGQRTYMGLEGTILEDNNQIGIALAATLPMFLYVARQSTSKLVRYGTGLVLMLSIIAVIGTQSRGALVSLVAFAGLMWLRSNRKLVTGAIMAAIAVIGLQAVPDQWVQRMETIAEAGEDTSFMGRVDAWVINYKLANEHPLTGVGLRVPYEQHIANTVSDREARAAHSIYFEVLGGTGYVGLGIYLFILGTAFFKARRAEWRYATQESGSWRAVFGRYAQMSILVFCLGGASVSMEMWEGYLIIIALIGSLEFIDLDASTKRRRSAPAERLEKTASDIRARLKK